MGTIKTRDLPKHLRPAAAALAEPEVCCVGAFLPCRVPTVGLHHKTRDHRDRKELRVAKALYATLLPSIARPVAGPVMLSIDFVLTPPRGMKPFDGVLPYTGKPDLANLVKVFEDALAARGWLVNDSHVVTHAHGKWVSFDTAWQGVCFTLRTICGGPHLPFFHCPAYTRSWPAYLSRGGIPAAHK